MVFNYSKLRGKIREVFKNEAKFAEAMGFSSATISAKLNNRLQFSQNEMNKACELLEIDKKEITVYFFTL